MTRRLPTVADLRALKGRGERTMVKVFALDEAASAKTAGIDIVSILPELMLDPRYREVTPTLFSMTGKTHLEAGTADDYLRWACAAMQAGANAIYCSGSLQTITHLAREHIPVGGFRAVGKTADQARRWPC